MEPSRRRAMWAVLISAVAPFFLLSVTSTKTLTQPLDVERIQKENEKLGSHLNSILGQIQLIRQQKSCRLKQKWLKPSSGLRTGCPDLADLKCVPCTNGIARDNDTDA